jgi:hypothetical protein
MRLFGIAGVLAGLVAASAAGQDAIEIKIASPKAGDRVKVTVEEKADSAFTVSAKGMEQAKSESKTKSLVYVDEVIDAAAGAKKPTKAKRTYEKAVVGANGKGTTLPVEGKTVLIEKTGDKYAFTVDGKAVEGEALRLLEGEFNKADKNDARDLMLPNKAVKPGDTWKIDGDALVKAMGDDLKLDRAKATATGKLVKAYKQDGKQFGVIELTITSPITDLGPKAPVKVKDGSLSVTLTGDGVIDGSSPRGKSTAVTKVKVTGGGTGFDLTLEVTATEKRTTEPLPKQ